MSNNYCTKCGGRHDRTLVRSVDVRHCAHSSVICLCFLFYSSAQRRYYYCYKYPPLHEGSSRICMNKSSEQHMITPFLTCSPCTSPIPALTMSTIPGRNDFSTGNTSRLSLGPKKKPPSGCPPHPNCSAGPAASSHAKASPDRQPQPALSRRAGARGPRRRNSPPSSVYRRARARCRRLRGTKGRALPPFSFRHGSAGLRGEQNSVVWS